MDNAIYVGLSRQMLLLRELDIVANNLANVDTVGFKFEDLLASADPQAPASGGGGASSPVVFVAGDGVAVLGDNAAGGVEAEAAVARVPRPRGGRDLEKASPVDG